MDKIDLTAIDDWPAAVVAVVIVLAVLVWPGFMAWLNTQKIAHQMRPNSGGSLRDAIDRIEARQKATDKTLGDHIEADGKWKTQVEEMLTGSPTRE